MKRGSARGRPWLGCASLAAAALWCAWPWLRPRLAPATGRPWLVVLDGYHRLDAALQLQRRPQQHHWPILLITCPATGQPTPAQQALAAPPLQRLHEAPPLGGDTAGQAAALAAWLRARPAALRPARVLLLSDPHHFPRAAWALQIAAGGFGTTVQLWPVSLQATDADPPPGSFAWTLLGPALRDALRLQVWRLAGSTGVEWLPEAERRRRARCWQQAS